MRNTKPPDTGETVFTPTFQRLRDSYFSNLLADEKTKFEQELVFDDPENTPSISREDKRKGKGSKNEEQPSPQGILSKVFFFFQLISNSSSKEEKKEDDKEEDVLFFHSPVELHEYMKVRLIGQIQALLEETNKYHPRDERVIVIHFQNVQLGMGYINSEIVFVIGFHRTIPMNLIRDQMHRLIEGMILLHGPQIQDIRPRDGMDIKDLIHMLGLEFVPLVTHLQSNVLSLFHPIIYFPLPYKHNSIFLKASQLLERFHRLNRIQLDESERVPKEPKSQRNGFTNSQGDSGYLGGAVIIGGEQILSRTIPEEVLHWMLVRVQNIGSVREDLAEWRKKEAKGTRKTDETPEGKIEENTILQKIEDSGKEEEEDEGEEEEEEDQEKIKKSNSLNSVEDPNGDDFDDLPPLEKLPTPPTEGSREEEEEQNELLSSGGVKVVDSILRKDVECITGFYCPTIHTMTPFVQFEQVFDDSSSLSDDATTMSSLEWIKMQNAMPEMRIHHNKVYDRKTDFLPPTVLVEFGNIRIHYSFAHVSRDSLEGMKGDIQGRSSTSSSSSSPSPSEKKQKKPKEDDLKKKKKRMKMLKEKGFPKCLWGEEEDAFAQSVVGGSYVFCVIIQVDTIVLLRLYDMVKLTQFAAENKRNNEEEFSFALQKLFGLKCQLEEVLNESDFSDFQFMQHQGMKVKNIAGKGKMMGNSPGGFGGDPMQFLSPEKEKTKSLVHNIVHQRSRSGSGLIPPKISSRESVMVFDTVSKILEGNFTEQRKKSFLPKLCMIHNHFENSGIHKIVLKNSKEVIYGKKVFDHEVYYVKETKKNEEENLTEVEKKVKEKLREEFKINIM